MSKPKICDFCSSNLDDCWKQSGGAVELEVLNISAGAVATWIVCLPCAALCSETPTSWDSDGTPYRNLGCIGGAPEEVN